RVRFVPIEAELAEALERAREAEREAQARALPPLVPSTPSGAVRRRVGAGDESVCYRRAGDDYLLVEYGPLVLDLKLRLRVQALYEWLRAERVPGIVDLTPGVRSLQIHFDRHVLDARRLLE